MRERLPFTQILDDQPDDDGQILTFVVGRQQNRVHGRIITVSGHCGGWSREGTGIIKLSGFIVFIIGLQSSRYQETRIKTDLDTFGL